jgi:multidrug efflux system outer membrane protein
LERFFATAEAQRAAKISLIAEVASKYYATRLAEEQIAVSRQTLQTVQRSYDLNKARRDAGESNELDLRTAESQVETARINVLTYERDLARGNNALVLLIGCSLPDALPPAKDFSSSGLVSAISSGMPSDLIGNRPDIRQAEHNLRASNANIGAARAAFFPSISLTGSAGVTSAEFSTLLGGGTNAWSFTPQVHVPIFNAGRNRANLHSAETENQIELANYEKSIQMGFREVSDALVDAASFDRQIPVSESLVETQSARFKLADERFLQGESPYLDVLTAQQDLFSAKLRLLSLKYQSLNSRISLYKSLGGGWK